MPQSRGKRGHDCLAPLMRRLLLVRLIVALADPPYVRASPCGSA